MPSNETHQYKQLVVVESPAVGVHADVQRRARMRGQHAGAGRDLQRHARRAHVARPLVCVTSQHTALALNLFTDMNTSNGNS